MLITEYTGGGFGSRATGAVICMIPALLAKKANAPVMMRITREEEQYIGGIRPGVHGRVKAGFAKDGRLLALDLFLIGENSAYEAQGDAASGGPLRVAALSAGGDALARHHGAHQHAAAPRAEPAGRAAGDHDGRAGGRQGGAPARHRSGGDPPLNAPEGKAKWGPANPQGQRGYATSAFVKEALDRGAELFGWENAQGAIGQAQRIDGARRRRGRQHVRRRIHRLRRALRHQARRQAVRPVGRRQPRHRVGVRRPPRRPPRCWACRGRTW